MQSTPLALALALAVSASSAWAVPTFDPHAKGKGADFSHASEGLASKSQGVRHAYGHDKNRGLGNPSFVDLSTSPPATPVVLGGGGEHAAQPAQDNAPPLAIPEPQTWALMFAGLGALIFLARRRR